MDICYPGIGQTVLKFERSKRYERLSVISVLSVLSVLGVMSVLSILKICVFDCTPDLYTYASIELECYLVIQRKLKLLIFIVATTQLLKQLKSIGDKRNQVNPYFIEFTLPYITSLLLIPPYQNQSFTFHLFILQILKAMSCILHGVFQIQHSRRYHYRYYYSRLSIIDFLPNVTKIAVWLLQQQQTHFIILV